jgi:hypothetical protein
MQLPYRVSTIQHILNQISRRALPHLSKPLPMTRHTARPQHKSNHPGAPAVLRGVPVEDWDALFSAVKARLTQIGQPLDPPGPPGAEPPDANTLQFVRAAVLECVQALDQVHTLALEEFARHGRDGP